MSCPEFSIWKFLSVAWIISWWLITETLLWPKQFLCMFVLLLYVTVNNFLVIFGFFPAFLGWTSTKQRIKCLTQGHNTVPPMSLKLKSPFNPTTELLHPCKGTILRKNYRKIINSSFVKFYAKKFGSYNMTMLKSKSVLYIKESVIKGLHCSMSYKLMICNSISLLWKCKTYSKTCLKQPLKNKHSKDLNDRW